MGFVNPVLEVVLIMKKKLKIEILVDRPSLCLNKGTILNLVLEGDALVNLYHEQAMGYVNIIEDSEIS